MTFTPEQAEEIKKQLLVEIDRLPNENKEQIKEYVSKLDERGLEEFLKKNKIQYTDSGISQAPAEGEESEEGAGGKPQAESKCIFCDIAKGVTPSYKIAETKKAIAVLEINPLSKGHVIIIPTEHVSIEKMPKSALSLAQKIAKKLKKKFKPEDIKIETSSFQGHPMVNVIPLYKDVQLKKIKADEKDLIDLQKKLKTTTRAKRKKEPKTEVEKPKKPEDLSKLPKISFRVP
jgi:diadenosine tetraphosphate (Ap4A) HIT family hydrolase